MGQGRRTPERRCVACGARVAQASLFRLHVEEADGEAQVVFDEPGELRTGRGAYLCRRRVCLERALKKRVFSRVFRRTVMIREEELRGSLVALLNTTSEECGR